MRNKFIFISTFLTGFILSFIIFIYYINFLPVGSVDGKIIYKYQLAKIQDQTAGNVIKNIGKDLAFDSAMADLGIHANENEIEKEWSDMVRKYGGIDELNKILLDTGSSKENLKKSIKHGMMKQKAIEYFASSVISDDANLKMEEGAKRYEEYISEYEEKVVIKIYWP